MQLGTCFERAWNTFQRYPAPFALSGLVVFVVNAVLGYLNQEIPLLGVVNWFVTTLLGAGLVIMAVNASRGQPIDVPDVFAAFRRPVPYLVVSLAIAVGVIACGIGVLVTAFLFVFANVLVAKGADFGEALTRSKDLALAHVGETILLIVSLIGLTLAGFLALGIGLIVAMPLASLVLVEAHNQLEGQARAPQVPAGY